MNQSQNNEQQRVIVISPVVWHFKIKIKLALVCD